MKAITIVDSQGDSQTHSYRLADRRLHSQVEIPEMAGLQVRGDPQPNDNLTRPFSPCQAAGDEMVFSGEGWIGGRFAEVRCRRMAKGYSLEVMGVGRFCVSASGEQILLAERAPACPEPTVRGTLLGPALVLALALQGIWCLHTGAVEVDGAAVLFLGESGKGKSTLAARLPGERFTRLADDVLPVGSDLEVLPRFPQLKLPADGQPALDMPEKMGLSHIYVLTEPAAQTDVILLSPARAALALARHTVAARLFDRKLLTDHLAFCARLASAVPVYSLHYPREIAALSGVAGHIEGQLGTKPPQ